MCVGPISGLQCLIAHSEQKVIKIRKKCFLNKKYTITICVGCVWIVIEYFLFEKHNFNGLSKVIGLQLVITKKI